MRHMKSLIPSVIAILIAAVWLEARPAAADSLCHDNVAHNQTCPTPVHVGTFFRGLTMAGEAAVLLNSSKEAFMSCHSTLLGRLGSNQGSHKGFLALIEKLELIACSGGCSSATGINTPHLMLANALALHVIIEKHASGGVPGMLMTGCFGFVNCQYSLTNGNALLDVSKDLLIANHEPVTRSGHSALCPATGFWDARYLLTLDEEPFDPLFLAALP